MRRHILFCIVLVLVTALHVASARPALADAESLASDEKLIADAGLRTDPASLLTYFRQRTLSETERSKLAAKVQLLGDQSFQVRETATQELIAAGRSAVPFLRPALKDKDLEI